MRSTVMADLAPDSTVVTEEIFGPVAALLPAGSFEEAIANDTPFGLTAAVFTRDLERALRLVPGGGVQNLYRNLTSPQRACTKSLLTLDRKVASCHTCSMSSPP